MCTLHACQSSAYITCHVDLATMRCHQKGTSVSWLYYSVLCTYIEQAISWPWDSSCGIIVSTALAGITMSARFSKHAHTS